MLVGETTVSKVGTAGLIVSNITIAVTAELSLPAASREVIDISLLPSERL